MKKLSVFASLTAMTIFGAFPAWVNADYVLSDGDSLTFSSASDFGSLDQSIIGPTEEGATATVTFNNGGEIRILTSKITGNITLVKNGGGYIRMSNAESNFTGPVYVNAGVLLIQSGKELGTGTIYLNGASLSNGGNGWASTTDAVMSNEIVLAEGKTSALRFAKGGGTISFTGNITGAGNLQIGKLASGYGEPEPVLTKFYGNNTYAGDTTLDHDWSKATVASFEVYGANAFGTGKLTVSNPSTIDFAKTGTENAANRTMLNSQIIVEKDKTLTLTNSGGGKVFLPTVLTGDGTLVISGTNFAQSFSSDATVGGNIQIKDGGSFTISQAYGKTLNPKHNISGSGTLILSGNGNMMRFQGQDNTSFNGDVIIDSGRVYLSNGKELGVGTIYLGGKGVCASLQNNSSDIDVPNDIVLVDGTTGYLRPYRSTTVSRFRGDITGSGNLVYGNNGYTWEPDNSVVALYGNNAYSGSTTVAHGGNGVFNFEVYGENGFGTGDFLVKNNASITFKTPADSGVKDRNVQNSSITVDAGKTLTLANESEYGVAVVGAVSNAGTLKLTKGLIAFADSITSSGTFTVEDGAALGVGTFDSATGFNLNVNGALTLNGDLVLNIFSDSDYDVLNVSGNLATGSETEIFLEISADPDTFDVVPLKSLVPGISDAFSIDNVFLTGDSDGFMLTQLSDGIYVGSSASLPEPASWIIFCLGSLGLFRLRRRK